MTTVRCQAYRCGAAYTVTTDGDGRVVGDCHQCARKRAGVCRDCPASVYGTVGKAVRCQPCDQRVTRDRSRVQMRAYRADGKCLPTTPEQRRKHADRTKRYRQRHPKTDADRYVRRIKDRQRRARCTHQRQEAQAA